MSNKERIIIKDSCILFDLLDLDMMEDFFRLEYNVFTTEYVISEVLDEVQLRQIKQYVSEGQIKIDDQGTYESIKYIFNQCKGLSFTDCSVLEFVIRTDGIVLSSDNTLRKEILKRKFTAKGLLWIIWELRVQDIISRESAISKLKAYQQINNRAPKTEISRLIDKLEE